MQQYLVRGQIFLFWGYLFLAMIAELVIAFVDLHIGQILYALLLGALFVYVYLASQNNSRKLALALVLGPMIRILSVSLPLSEVPLIWWYPSIGMPLLIAAGLIVHHLGMLPHELGFRRSNLLIEGMIGLSGLALGAYGYTLLQPAPLAAQFSLEAIIVPALILVIFTGFAEEFIFRGLLQTLARQLLGFKGLVFVALLFAVLHIGYRSLPIFLAVLSFGLVAGCAVLYTQSILGVTIAHSLTNIMLFFVMPYTLSNPKLAVVVDWLVALGVLGGIAALVTIFFSVMRSRRALAHQRLLPQDTGSHSGSG
jgi:hypothetical protein